jgi:hypothetical protein
VFTQWWTVENDTTRTEYNAAVDGTALTPTLSNLGGALFEQLTPELVVVGEFNLNLGNAGTPSCARCELTFSCGGIFLAGFEEEGTDTFEQVSPGVFEEIMIMLPVIDTSTAWINVYVDNDNPSEFDKDGIIDSATVAAIDAEIDDAVDGDLWLSLTVEDFIYTPDQDAIDDGEPLTIGSTSSYGNVVDGLAINNFESDFFIDLFDTQEFGLTASFKEDGVINNYANTGTGAVRAHTVPEPSTLAIFGILVLGVAGLAKARKMS